MPLETDIKKILVAEDHAALATVVKFNLEHAGFDVTIARNGREAWEKLQHEHFDLLVTDQQMPEMSGCQLCQKMRDDGRFTEIPIIMLTAKGLELEFSELHEQFGVKQMLAKPFSPRELVFTVRNCLLVEAC